MKSENRGSTFVELILSMVLISISALIMSGVLKDMINYGSKKDRLFQLALNFESEIISKSQDLVYMKTYSRDLRRGVIPTNFIIDKDGLTIAANNQVLGFSETGTSCNQVIAPCPITTEIQIQCFPGADYPDCRLGYQIRFNRTNNNKSGIELAEIGAQGSDWKTPINAPKNFGLLLAYDVFSNFENEDPSLAPLNRCEENGVTNRILSGYNKVDGSVACVSLPTAKCSAGQIPKGMVFNSGTRSFEMACEISRQAHCPPNYVLNQVNTFSGADPTSNSTVRCVFIGKDRVPWQRSAGPAPSINQRFCPDHYRTTNTNCQLNSGTIVNVIGKCPIRYPCTSVVGGRPVTVTCTRYEDGTTPSAPQIVKTDGSVNASCDIQQGTGSCGGYSYYSGAQLTMSGECQLVDPKFEDGWWQ